MKVARTNKAVLPVKYTPFRRKNTIQLNSKIISVRFTGFQNLKINIRLRLSKKA